MTLNGVITLILRFPPDR